MTHLRSAPPLPEAPPHPVRTPHSDSVEAAPKMSFEQAATLVLGNLQSALIALLAAAPSEIRKAVDVERVLGVDRRLGWHIYRIAKAKNPLAAGEHVPARVSMKKLLTSAARRRVPSEIIDQVSEAFEAFERFVETDASDRAELEAMLNAFLPEERHKQEMASREAAFKAESQIRGIANEADVAMMFFLPSDRPGMVDRVSLSGAFGIRRSRPNTAILLGIGNSNPDVKADSPTLSLDGRPYRDTEGLMLPQFSTVSMTEQETFQREDMVYTCLAGKDVGLRSAINIVTASRHPHSQPLYAQPGVKRFVTPSYTTSAPVKRLTFDIMIHRDVYHGVVPQLRTYHTIPRGQVALFDDPLREIDLLENHEVIRPLPIGISGAALVHLPIYIDMLKYMYDQLGYNPAEFRGYRLDVQYPIYGAFYMIGLRLPVNPANQ